MLSFEHIQFLDEKILQYLPSPFTQTGDKINCRCPICGDSKKSMTKKRGWVYLKNASYYCFNCGTSLSGIKLLKAIAGTDYDKIYEEYMKLFLKSGLDNSLSSVMWKPNQDDEPGVFNLKRALDPNLKKPLSEDARKYLERRMVLKAPFLKEPLFSLYSTDGKKEYVLIPWKVNGIDAYYQVNDFMKYRPSMKYVFPKDRKKLIYGLDNIDPSYKKIFVFEGVYDSLFVKNGIATGTKSITAYQTRLIKERWPHHKICLAFDNDDPGFSSTVKFIELGKADMYFAWFKDGATEKDINERVLSTGDVNMFSDPKKLDKLVFDSLQMKFWLMSHGKWLREDKFQKKKAVFASWLGKPEDLMGHIAQFISHPEGI